LERGLQYIHAGIQDGQFKPVVDRTFLFEQIVEAYRYMESNQQMSREGQPSVALRFLTR
jgi:NADPH:quinone reductase-like Zn-dependent oxidoreductase